MSDQTIARVRYAPIVSNLQVRGFAKRFHSVMLAVFVSCGIFVNDAVGGVSESVLYLTLSVIPSVGEMDGDGDGDVDLFDYAELANCLAGPGGSLGAGCSVYDGDADGDVDLADYGTFQVVQNECRTSAPSWPNFAITEEVGAITVEYDAVPNSSGMDGLTGLSFGESTYFTDSAVTPRFNVNGFIDAWDGVTGWYAADSSIPYTPGTTYRFRLAVDIPARAYSVFVKPHGGQEQVVGSNFKFRTQAGDVTSLDHWHAWAGVGTHEVCNFTVTGHGNQAPTAEAGPNLNIAWPNDYVVLAGEASDDGHPVLSEGTTAAWSVVSAPASVEFDDSADPGTGVTLGGVGAYVLRLTIDDGALIDTDDVTITVGDELVPVIGVDVTSLDFGNSNTALGFSVWNAGSGALWYTVSSDAGWLVLDRSAGSSWGEVDYIGATVDRSGLSSGVHTAQITIADMYSSNTALIDVTMSVSASTPMTTASFASGVAPLAVHFDALEASSGVVQPPDGDHATFRYRWSFGDPGSGNWSTTGNSRNEACGYLAGHVYEEPGVYTVTLHVTDTSGQTHTYTQAISVSAFSGATYYVSAAGNDSNSGTSTGSPLRTFGAAMGRLGSNVRILFRRGDIFDVPSQGQISTTGPGIIGAYGNAGSPRPVLRRTGSDNVFRLRSAGWRLMDLELDGDNNASAGSGVDVSSAAHRESLMLRLYVHGFDMGIWNTFFPTPIQHDHVFLVDSEVADQGNKGVFMGGSRLVFLGNNIHDSGSHLLRVWHAIRTVISNNALRDPHGGSAAALKLHNAIAITGLPDGRYIVISDNVVRGVSWDVTIGTQDDVSYEVVRDVVVERNRTEASGTTNTGWRINAQNVTFRNNVGDFTGYGGLANLVNVSQWGVEPPPTGARIYNNAAYRSDSQGVRLIGASLSDTWVCNNIAYSVGGSSWIGPGGSLYYNNIEGNPGWVNPSGGDFHLLPSSPAIDAGIAGPVMDDFDCTDRPLDGDGNSSAIVDIGPSEYAP